MQDEDGNAVQIDVNFGILNSQDKLHMSLESGSKRSILRNEASKKSLSKFSQDNPVLIEV